MCRVCVKPIEPNGRAGRLSMALCPAHSRHGRGRQESAAAEALRLRKHPRWRALARPEQALTRQWIPRGKVPRPRPQHRLPESPRMPNASGRCAQAPTCGPGTAARHGSPPASKGEPQAQRRPDRHRARTRPDITGNRELGPKCCTSCRGKALRSFGDLLGKPVNSPGWTTVLQPLDRDVFQRRKPLLFYDAFRKPERGGFPRRARGAGFRGDKALKNGPGRGIGLRVESWVGSFFGLMSFQFLQVIMRVMAVL